MLQGTDQRILRTASRFQWESRRVRIAQAVLFGGEKISDVASAENLKEKTVRNELALARRDLYAQAVSDCIPEAFEVDCRYEEDPLTVNEHAKALMIVTGYENEFEDCKGAVLAVGAY